MNTKPKPTEAGTARRTTVTGSIRTTCATRLLALLLLVLPGAVQGQFNFTTTNGTTITITGYTGPGGAVVIPGTINGLPVTRIGNSAFFNKTTVTSVTIPNSVRILADSAFGLCNSLASVTIPDSVTSIENGAFHSCTSLTNVASLNGVTNIGRSAFAFCRGLTSVTIPRSVTSIQGAAFVECTHLGEITVDALNPVYSSLGGVLLNKGQNQLVVFPAGKAGSYTILESVTSIGDYAFSGCASLTSVTIPNSVTSIGVAAFHGCASLTSLTIPNSVTNIEDSAFSTCISLTSVTISDRVLRIQAWTFESCHSLTNVTIPSSVTHIELQAFNYCRNLASIAVPRSVISIGTDAFGSCPNLSGITVDPLNSFYSSVGGVLFNKSQTRLIRFPGGQAGSYTIPDSVTSIEEFAFRDSPRLSSVTIPNGVTGIGNYAFLYCPNLSGVYFQGNAPSVGVDLFLPANNVTVYYLPGTAGWGATLAGRPAVLWHPLVNASNASFGVRTNRFGFTITGASSLVIVVEASTNLANPIWSMVGTNILIGGSSYFSDPEWTNHPARFYRFRSP